MSLCVNMYVVFAQHTFFGIKISVLVYHVVEKSLQHVDKAVFFSTFGPRNKIVTMFAGKFK